MDGFFLRNEYAWLFNAEMQSVPWHQSGTTFTTIKKKKKTISRLESMLSVTFPLKEVNREHSMNEKKLKRNATLVLEI